MPNASMLAMVLLVSLSLTCSGQTRQAGAIPDAKDQTSVPLEPRAATYRPKITLQQALKIAEDYISQEHIDVRQRWLYRAVYILVGDEKTPDEKKLPAWHFWWVNEAGGFGDDVEILVYMDGKAYRAPSM